MELVVTVDDSWEISDSFLVTWWNMKCDIFYVERDVISHDHVQKNLKIAYFFEKWTLSENGYN